MSETSPVSDDSNQPENQPEKQPEVLPAASKPAPRACGCFCGACGQGLHQHCSHVTPCQSECGCACAACKRGDHDNCSHAQTCPKGKARAGVILPSTGASPIVVGPDPMPSRPTNGSSTQAATPAPLEDAPEPPGRVPGRVIATLWRERISRLEDALSQCPATADRSTVLLELAKVKETVNPLMERLELIEKVVGKLLGQLRSRGGDA